MEKLYFLIFLRATVKYRFFLTIIVNKVVREKLIICTCKKEKKIPFLELEFVRYPREKIRTKSMLQQTLNY